jgi:FkbM family methyltransferase
MNDLTLRLADGTLIALAASLNTITTYVLLEQEAWFEKEASFIPFLLKPGMIALDIGANVGVYSLCLARRVGPAGKVYAYEPASEPRRLLAKSQKANSLENLHIIGAAVSNRPGQAHLAPGISSELASLSDSNSGERVDVRSLDEEDVVRNWGSPDFVKIDAEGEECRIIEGGRAFFTRHSPLVMFEVKAGDAIDKAIPKAFRALGYRIFRLLPGAPILVPFGPDEPLDTFELNLFAAKPDRIAILAGAGHLAEEVRNWSPNDSQRTHALDLFAAQTFGPVLAQLPAPHLGAPYRDAFAGYALWRSQSASPSLRYAALRFSHAVLRDLCQSAPQAARLSTFARVAWELGERSASIAIMQAIVALSREKTELVEPFWPVNARFDAIAPGTNVGQWFLVSLLEQLECASAYSSMFIGDVVNLDWLRQQPFVSTQIERRYALKQMRAGKRIATPEKLCRPAEDHLNADLWRSGSIPNTLASR